MRGGRGSAARPAACGARSYPRRPAAAGWYLARMGEEADISVVVLSWNTRELTLSALRSVEAAVAPLRGEAVCVDNASRDGTAAAVREALPGVRVIENAENLGFARGNNAALPVLRGRYACFLNSDAEASPGALAYVVRYLDAHPKA